MALTLRDAAPYLRLGAAGVAFLAMMSQGGGGSEASDTVPAPGGAGGLQPGEGVILVGDSLGVGLVDLGHIAALIPQNPFVSVVTTGHNAHQTLSDLQASSAAGGVALISLGTNDAALFDTASMAPYVTQLVQLLRDRGARRVLWIVPPNYAITNPPSPATPGKQATFRSMMEGAGVEVLEPPPDVVAKIAVDRMHLPPSGYQALAEAAIGAVS